MDFRTIVVAAALLAAVAVQGIRRPRVYKLHVLSEVRNRYAKTLVTSKVANPARKAQEISFDAVLPENAFISRFVIEMDGVAYEAYVRGKEEAKQEYDSAVAAGRGAAHVAVNARDSNVVHVSVNVEAQKKVTFNLTYEELLQREIGAYNLRININPGQPVDDLAVEVKIEEQAPLRLVEVPTLQLSNEITDTPNNATDPLARVERPTPSSATVRWAPTPEEQRQRREEGISGQLVVRYDVDREASPSQILVSEDGYFVHFYAPPGLPPLPKHVVFVLDVSGSMRGRKIEQLKTAMHTILDELNEGDIFSLIPFSSEVQVWHPDVPLNFAFEYTWPSNSVTEFNSSAIVEATSENIAKAKNSIDSFQASGATYMFSALQTALRLSDLAAASKSAGSGGSRRRHAPILLLLTDGEPNGDVSDTDEIVRRITSRNAESGAAIFTLAFGYGADYDFLRRLALRNSGVGRRIYEAADAHLQLRNFYRQIASPLLADVTFNYDGNQVDEESLTTAKFPNLFGGGELVVAGRLAAGTRELWCAIRSSDGNATHAVPQPSVANVTSAERLWAYLTVRQLLDRDAATPNQTVRAKAKGIALRYSFVTSVTSLVVVKPNETSAVNLDEADDSSGSDEYRSASMPLSFQHGWSALPAVQFGLDAQRSPGGIQFVPPRQYNPIHTSALLASSLDVVARSGFRTGISFDAVATSDTSTGISFDAVATIDTTTERTLTLDDVTWLPALRNGSQVTLSVNGTELHLQLAQDQSDAGFQSCSPPVGSAGVCRHLAACVRPEFSQQLDVFVSDWLCVVDGSFLGVCCPDTTSVP